MGKNGYRNNQLFAYYHKNSSLPGWSYLYRRNIIQEQYFTEDNGKTWHPFTPTTALDEFAVDPFDLDHVLAIDENTALMHSRDMGSTFMVVNFDFTSAKISDFEIPEDGERIYVSNTGLGISCTGAPHWREWSYMLESPDYSYDFEIDPDNDHILYAANSPKIFESGMIVPEILHLDGGIHKDALLRPFDVPHDKGPHDRLPIMGHKGHDAFFRHVFR